MVLCGDAGDGGDNDKNDHEKPTAMTGLDSDV